MAANYSTLLIRVSMLIILLIWSLHVATGLEAKGYGGRKTMQKRINSKTILHELGYDLSKMKKQQNKWRMALADDRIVPGGPDPEHHSCPPALLCKAVGNVKCRNSSNTTTTNARRC